MAKESILITGGAGYLGSVMSRYLLEEGYKVSCLDNLMYKQNSLFDLASNPDFDFIYGDVRNETLMKKTIPEFDDIIPLAAIVGMPSCDQKPSDAQSINFGAIKLLDQVRGMNQKVIYPDTNSGYGTHSGDLYCTEETPLEPISLYGKTKVEAEIILLNSNKDAVILRLATVFGISPRMRTDLLVNDFVHQALTAGSIEIYEKDFKRNFIHIRDVARAFEHSIRNFDSMKNEPYNLGLDDANISKWELAEKIKRYIPRFSIHEGIGKDPDKRNYIVSNEKIKKTGFETRYSLDDGIRELIKGYQMLFKADPFRNC